MIQTIGVLGGGAWGTALALAASRAGRKVRLWARDHATVAAIDETHENPRHLPGIRLDHIPATTNIAVALRADAILLAVPAQAVRAVAAIAAPYLAHGVPLVATRILSHTQVLNDDVCFLVEPQPDQLAEGLVRALTDTAGRRRVVTNAQRLYATAYARPVYERKLRKLFEKLGCGAAPPLPMLAAARQSRQVWL